MKKEKNQQFLGFQGFLLMIQFNTKMNLFHTLIRTVLHRIKAQSILPSLLSSLLHRFPNETWERFNNKKQLNVHGMGLSVSLVSHLE